MHTTHWRISIGRSLVAEVRDMLVTKNGLHGWLLGFSWICTVIYGIATFYLLFIRDRIRGMFYQGQSPWNTWYYPFANLKPFHTIHSYLYHADDYNFDTWFQVFFGNLALFLPYGVLAPLLITGMRSFPMFASVLFLVITGVEIIQKLTMTGTFDVDDIILNFIGGIAGYWLSCYLFRRVWKSSY
jgi:glycopeptide antibiotics resistance protein